MAKKRIPLHLVTLFHPERWVRVDFDQLTSLPCINRDRETLEKRRIDMARTREINLTFEPFHGDRPISNCGIPIYSLRETWISTKKLSACLEEFDIRLIHTKENRPQARYKFEFRPDWVDQPGILDEVTKDEIHRNIRSVKKISIRQLWKNPIATRFGTLPLEVPAEIAKETANLIIGPIYSRCNRKANLDFEKINGVWWLRYSE